MVEVVEVGGEAGGEVAPRTVAHFRRVVSTNEEDGRDCSAVDAPLLLLSWLRKSARAVAANSAAVGPPPPLLRSSAFMPAIGASLLCGSACPVRPYGSGLSVDGGSGGKGGCGGVACCM